MSQITLTGVNLFNLDGRVAIISGAAGHLGKSMSLALCEAGATVILNGRTAEKVEAFAKELQDAGYKAFPAIFDITQDSELVHLINYIESQHGRLDIVVNNAYSGRTGTVESSTVKDFEDAYKIAVTTAFRLVQIAKPLLQKTAQGNRGGTSVINISSMYGTVSPDPAIYGDSGANNPPFYGAAKAGLIQLTKYLACHLASAGIRVNCISPGPFPPQDIKINNELFYNELCRKNPMNRIGLPDELKGPLLFLASDASSFVTGINLPVDGGWTAW